MAGLPPFFQQLVPQPGPTLPAPALQDVLTWLAQLQKAAPRTTDIVPAGQGILVDPEIITGRDMAGPAKAITLPARPEYFPPGVPKKVDLSAQRGAATGTSPSPHEVLQMLAQAMTLGLYKPKDPRAAQGGQQMLNFALGTVAPGGGEGAAGEDAFKLLQHFLKQGNMWVEGTHALSDNPYQGEYLAKIIKMFFKNAARFSNLKARLPNIEKDVTDLLGRMQKAIEERYVGSVEKEFGANVEEDAAKRFVKKLPGLLRAHRNYQKAADEAMEELRKVSRQGLAEDAILARNALLTYGEQAGIPDVAESPLARALEHEARMRATLGQTEIDTPGIRELQAQSATRDPIAKTYINTLLNEFLSRGGGQF